MLPHGGAHRGLGLDANVLGLRSDERMLAIRFVPDRDHRDAALGGFLERAKLGAPFAAEPVADPDRVLFELHVFCVLRSDRSITVPHRWMRADPPLANARTCSRVAIVVSPGNVVSRAPWAQPRRTASLGDSPASSP